jgi:hypothetical protein
MAASPERTAEAPRFSAVRFIRVRSFYGFKLPGDEHRTEDRRSRKKTLLARAAARVIWRPKCIPKVPRIDPLRSVRLEAAAILRAATKKAK